MIPNWKKLSVFWLKIREWFVMSRDTQSRQITIRKLSANQSVTVAPDKVTLEVPLEIRIRGKDISKTMRTSGNDIDLVAGFISTEGIIKKRSDILEIAHCKDDKITDDRNFINVYLYPDISINLEKMSRQFYTNSSCGICGKKSIESLKHCSLRLNQIFQSQLKSSIGFRINLKTYKIPISKLEDYMLLHYLIYKVQ